MPPLTGRGSTEAAQRGRAVLLWALLGAAGLQLGLALAIEYPLPQLRDPFYAHKASQLRRRLSAGPRPYTIVMLGSSRTTFGLKSREAEQLLTEQCGRPVALFNFGLTGAGPLLELVTLQRLRAEGIRPDLLLVEVLPPLLNDRIHYEAPQVPPERLWLRELPSLTRYGLSAGRLRAAWWRGWGVPWYTHRYAIVSHVLPSLLPYQLRQDWFRHVDGSGWIDPPYRQLTPEGRRRALENARREYAPYLTHFQLGGPECTALRDLLEQCRHEHVPVGLVWMPEGETFRTWYPPEALAQIEPFLARLSRRYDAPLIDARGWMPEEQFSDSHHLLPEGATAFSNRLAREAVLPLLRTVAGDRTEANAADRRAGS